MYLYQVGEHFAAGASLESLNDLTNPQVELVGEFMRQLNIALGGSGRIA